MTAGSALYYAITPPAPGKGDYLAMCLRSLRSLRAVSPDVKVYCVLFGAFPAAAVAELEALGGTVIRKRAVPPERRYLIKFLALRGLPERTLLFMDADTYLFEPIEGLFRQHQRCSLYARVEWGCDRTGPNHQPNECNWPMIDRMADALGVPGTRRLPLYNTGVMLLNHGFHRRLLSRLDFIAALRDLFASGELPYPHFYNRHVVGEMATLFGLGAFPEHTFGVLEPRACTFWPDHQLDPRRDWGIVCHTFAAFYDAFLARLPEALRLRGAGAVSP
jgi:hypothetical protein